jgi:lysophospholipase L1-like esterase
MLQGLVCRVTIPRLPEPAGARSGDTGSGSLLRVLILGDSAAAGVGVSSQAEALSGRLVAELALTHRVLWSLIAKSGVSTDGTTRHLMSCPTQPFDIVVVSLGGNDVTGRRAIARWLKDIDTLVALLRSQFSARHILLSGVPPMHAFPGFPQPLRWYLGTKARQYNAALARWAEGEADCEHVALTLPDHDGLFAADGMHPGREGYRVWSAELAKHIRARWAVSHGAEPGRLCRYEPNRSPRGIDPTSVLGDRKPER